jgi:hypothetical protein
MFRCCVNSRVAAADDNDGEARDGIMEYGVSKTRIEALQVSRKSPALDRQLLLEVSPSDQYEYVTLISDSYFP